MFREVDFPKSDSLQKYLAEDEFVTGIETSQDYGYEIVGIGGNGRKPGDSVLLVMPDRTCGVEPVTLVGPKTLTITPLAGQGKIIVARADSSEVEVYRTNESVQLEIGDTYGYKNCGDAPYIVRDDCTPAFHLIDELELMKDQEHPVPADFLAEYGKD